MCMYIYIYIICICMYVCVYIYIYIADILDASKIANLPDRDVAAPLSSFGFE